MKTIKELDKETTGKKEYTFKLREIYEHNAYLQALKDVLKLIDDIETSNPLVIQTLNLIKTRIEG